MQKNKALVIFSGGLDSTTTLYYALHKNYQCTAITFDYGQRHSIEIKQAKTIAKKCGNIKHSIVKLDPTLFNTSSLIDISMPIPAKEPKKNEIPSTYVPARNLVFLSLASAFAEVHNINNIFLGVNIQDYSGYPDCRPEFIRQFTKTINIGTKQGLAHKFKIHTPLIKLNKMEIIKLAVKVGAPLDLSWSCYNPVKKGSKYIPCGICNSCYYRNKGFSEYEKSLSKFN